MRTYKDIGITFKQRKIGEADMIVSILTKYHGRVDTIAKGIRKITSLKAGNMDLITLSKFSFAKGKNLDVITEVKLINQYETLKRKLQPTLILFYLCELLDNFTKVGIRQKQLFQLIFNLLNTLKNSKNTLPLRAFELKLLTNAGFSPNLDTCLICNKALEANRKRYLAFDQAGFFCLNEKQAKGKVVSDRVLKVLRFLSNNDINKSIKLKKDNKLEKELQGIIVHWIESVLEKKLKSRKYLK